MKQLFFAIVGFIKFFRPRDWTIRNIQVLVNNTRVKVIEYFYNGKVYKYIGETLPKSIARGFFLPIQAALWNGRNVVDVIKKYSGPRNDFYGKDPELDFIFYKVIKKTWIPKLSFKQNNAKVGLYLHFEDETHIEPEEGILEVTNVIGQTSVFGAKKNLISPKLATV
jgi:nucleoside diphosphate kinase